MKTISDISPRYNPAELEDRWYQFWISENYFHASAQSSKKPYTIMIPPPNVTGILHVGHAFNNTLQDIIIRTRRMQGFETLWMPGTDHAGIATQNVVEKALKKEGKTRHDLGREAFIRRVWEWKKEHGDTIIRQLKKLGCSCDWERERFTMDEGLSKAVREAFCRLYEEKLIYRGYYLVNWCPRCRTALADDEVEHQEKKGAFYHIRYHFSDDQEKFVVIATTRPETMLGDTAVAVNPDDERYQSLIGKKLILPLVNREIPVIADRVVDREFGTGCLKVTPAHDPNDYEIGKRHDLQFISVMDEDGKMNDKAGEYQGLDRYACRKKIVSDLEQQGYLIKTEPHVHAVGHCYRCETEIEPFYSEQWFVSMKPLAEPALKAVREGKIRFHPENWVKTYENWMTGIRDWCISRQLWWGHRIPVFYCDECGHIMASRVDPDRCEKCQSSKIRQDEDVLDTWFSSQLWPFSTLGWPEKTPELDKFYPTSTLSTAFDIIFFWVARMVMSGMKFMDDIPFSDVYIHALLRDEQGRKMSKSLGNAIDPVGVIDEYGADALRFTMAALALQGRDVNLSVKKIEGFRNFMNKLWNAHRYILMNMDGFESQQLCKEKLTLPDRWILSRLEKLVKEVNENFDLFRFSHSAMAIYEFLWDEFCDWYIEISKVALAEGGEKRKQTQNILLHVLTRVNHLLHPYTPFITEQIRENMGIEKPLIISDYPVCDESLFDSEAEKFMSVVSEIVRAGRNFRSEYNIPPQKEIDLIIRPLSSEISEIVRSCESYIVTLTKCRITELNTEATGSGPCGAQAVSGASLYFPLKGLVDFEKEILRLKKEEQQICTELEKIMKKLDNEGFVSKAKPEVIKEQKEKQADFNQKLESLRENLKKLEG